MYLYLKFKVIVSVKFPSENVEIVTETGTAHCWPAFVPLCQHVWIHVGFEQRYEEKKYYFCCNYEMTNVLIKMHKDTRVSFFRKMCWERRVLFLCLRMHIHLLLLLNHCQDIGKVMWENGNQDRRLLKAPFIPILTSLFFIQVLVVQNCMISSLFICRFHCSF